MAADPNKVYRLKTDGEAVLISDADTLDAFARWSGWDGTEQFLKDMKMNANDLLNHRFYITGGTCHLCDPDLSGYSWCGAEARIGAKRTYTASFRRQT